MSNNLQMYHTVFAKIREWLPKERVTRQKNLALLVTGLVLGMGVQLPKIVRKWPVKGKQSSLVNRLSRFLKNPRMEVFLGYEPIAKGISRSFSGKSIRLVVDCTKVGRDCRLLSLGIAYRKRSLPLAWTVYQGKKGGIKAEEVIKLFARVEKMLPENSPVWVMGDCGFQAVKLLKWFRRRNWHFVIRQPKNIFVYSTQKNWVQLADFPLKEGQTRQVGWVRLTKEHNAGWYWLVLHWKRGEEHPWFLIADKPGQLIRLYKLRMLVEETYRDWKKQGFDLESTHLEVPERISRLVLGVCIAYIWLLTLGAWVVKNGYRHLVDRKSRRDKSYFRIGWDWIEDRLRLGMPFRFHFIPIF